MSIISESISDVLKHLLSSSFADDAIKDDLIVLPISFLFSEDAVSVIDYVNCLKCCFSSKVLLRCFLLSFPMERYLDKDTIFSLFFNEVLKDHRRMHAIEAFLNTRVSLKQKDEYGIDAITHAVICGNRSIVQELIRLGANLHDVDTYKGGLLVDAFFLLRDDSGQQQEEGMYEDCTGLILLLLEQGLCVQCALEYDFGEDGKHASLLSFLCRYADLNDPKVLIILLYLFKAGADPNETTDALKGHNPLSWATASAIFSELSTSTFAQENNFSHILDLPACRFFEDEDIGAIAFLALF